jgi:hypothetical protein
MGQVRYWFFIIQYRIYNYIFQIEVSEMDITGYELKAKNKE